VWGGLEACGDVKDCRLDLKPALDVRCYGGMKIQSLLVVSRIVL